MTKTSKTLAMLVMAGLALSTACNSTKEVTLQVKTQSGVVEGFMEDGVKKFLGIRTGSRRRTSLEGSAARRAMGRRARRQAIR